MIGQRSSGAAPDDGASTDRAAMPASDAGATLGSAPPAPVLVYKILRQPDWQDALARGRYDGSADDRRDGYIHLSAAHQAGATAAKYFAGQVDLVLVAFEAAALGAALRWEVSRGGDLFPHLYSHLPTALAVSVTALPLDAGGVPQLPPALAT